MKARLLMGVLMFSACPKDQSQVTDESDPLIQKLKAEQARGSTAHSPGDPPENKLADAVVRNAPPMELTPLPQSSLLIGSTSIEVIGLMTMQSVHKNGMAITTGDNFVKVMFSAQTTEVDSIDVGASTLSFKGESFGIAKDIQKIASGSALQVDFKAGDKKIITAYFEVPSNALSPGLMLNLVTSKSKGTLPLQ